MIVALPGLPGFGPGQLQKDCAHGLCGLGGDLGREDDLLARCYQK